MNNVTLKIFLSRHLPPARIFILSFAGVIVLGAFALWFSFSASQQPLAFVDALFMSTSGVCFTGLATVDIGKDLSLTGQIITLILFQIGGLGIITFSVFLFGIMGRGISFKEREIIQSVFMHTPRRDFLVILKSVLLFTLIIETVGTLLLFIRFSQDFPLGQALYTSIYHAVSAFNNCGYSLFSDSLVRYQGDWIVNLTIMGLLILGGIGFIVLHELMARWRGPQKSLSVHTKIVLITTGFLIVSGAALFYLFERNFIVKDLDLSTTLLVSIFQAVSPRTCGFNTVDLALLTNEAVQEVKDFSTKAIVADGTDRNVMETIGVREEDIVVISFGEDLAASTLATLHLKQMKVQKIIVKAPNDEHKLILEKVGATEVIIPEKEMANKIAKGLISPNVLDYIPLTEDYIICEIAPPSSFIGKSIAQLQLRGKHHIEVIAVRDVLTDQIQMVPGADFVIKGSEVLVVIGKEGDIDKVK